MTEPFGTIEEFKSFVGKMEQFMTYVSVLTDEQIYGVFVPRPPPVVEQPVETEVEEKQEVLKTDDKTRQRSKRYYDSKKEEIAKRRKESRAKSKGKQYAFIDETVKE